MRHNMPMAAVDARTLVPVSDEIGGLVVYLGGRAAYYVLNGEWFAALPEPRELVSSDAMPPQVAGSPRVSSSASEVASTL